jgi:hypothetical protein
MALGQPRGSNGDLDEPDCRTGVEAREIRRLHRLLAAARIAVGLQPNEGQDYEIDLYGFA